MEYGINFGDLMTGKRYSEMTAAEIEIDRAKRREYREKNKEKIKEYN
jgi:hypothetical protein